MSLFTQGLFTTVAIIVLVIFFLSAALRILKEYERGVIFRLGRIINAKGPGLIILIPIIELFRPFLSLLEKAVTDKP